jgi:hypothetical protein
MEIEAHPVSLSKFLIFQMPSTKSLHILTLLLYSDIIVTDKPGTIGMTRLSIGVPA